MVIVMQKYVLLWMVICGGSNALRVTRGSLPRACAPGHDQFQFCNASIGIEKRVEDLIDHLNLEEKILLLTARASPRGAVERLGIPEYNWGANCVHGVQSTCGTKCATSFPNPVNFGAMFEPGAAYQMAKIIGIELRSLWLQGATENYENAPHLGLDCWSPNINLNRDPR